MRKYNNKQRQNAVFCLKPQNMFSRFLKGKKTPNGYFKTTYKSKPLIPRFIQEEIKKQWETINRGIMSTMPLSIYSNRAEYKIKGYR